MADEEKGLQRGISVLNRLAGNGKSRRIILALGAIGIGLIFFSSFFGGEEKNSQMAELQSGTSDMETYTEKLETGLTEIVNGINGGTDAKVLVTLEKGTEYVYATEAKETLQKTEDSTSGGRNQENSSLETGYIIIKDADGGQQALAVTEMQPVVKGVVILCSRGNDPKVQQDIINAVTTALNISSARVCVIKQN